MPSLFDADARERILGRIGRLSPDRRPAWGRFTAGEMVCHMTCELRHALGELEAAPRPGPLARFPMNWLAIHLIPWPKGLGKSPPEFLAMRPTTWDADCARLADLVRRLGARGPAAAWPPSPVFGRLSARDLGVMEHKHLDHHLRQFGV